MKYRPLHLIMILAAVIVLWAPPTAADDQRVLVHPDQSPWAAVVKIQTNIGSRCTGVLIAPTVVLTAAHCLYNQRTRAFLQALSLHVLLGYERGGYRWHRLIAGFVIGDGFKTGKGPPTADWARLQLAEAVPSDIAPLPLATKEPQPGMQVNLAGYNQDRAQLLLADLACRVFRIDTKPSGGTLIVHDCAGTRGTSGAPLLVQQTGSWAVLGINIAAGRGANLALAVRGMR